MGSGMSRMTWHHLTWKRNGGTDADGKLLLPKNKHELWNYLFDGFPIQRVLAIAILWQELFDILTPKEIIFFIERITRGETTELVFFKYGNYQLLWSRIFGERSMNEALYFARCWEKLFGNVAIGDVIALLGKIEKRQVTVFPSRRRIYGYNRSSLRSREPQASVIGG
ncbi:MAG: hypothetical protein NTW60_01995 [Candidatus Wolfebacteria bacterium]|nr:hypothetical protein [Candidatus Wolfebacteria bacterium]